MAVVWSALHRQTGVRTAVKILDNKLAEQPALRAALRRELRAVAALDHPGVVLVLDSGEISEEDAANSNERLVNGVPWLAMELANGGTLGRLPLRTWAAAQAVFHDLLQALGHAHARGVIHRDLKPTNVLVCLESDERPGLKITDFGIAHLVDPDHAPDTPRRASLQYAAPESLLGRWRDYGPWTDLYSLGCVAWRLLVGRPPYHGRKGRELVDAHLAGTLPAFAPRIGVPADLEEWLRGLIAPTHGARYASAADAIRDLKSLHKAGTRIVAKGRITTVHDVPTSFTPIDHSIPATSGMTHASSEEGGPPSLRHGSWTIPRDWRGPSTHAHAPLQGAGLALFALRTVPFVGRHRARDTLWSALRRVADTDAPQVVVASGPSGTGKTRLAAWLLQRAHELTGAVTLRATHGPAPAATDGLSAMLGRFMRTFDLPRAEVLDRVRQFHHLLDRAAPEEDAVALLEFLFPLSKDISDGLPRVRFGTVEERHALLARVLGRISQSRPLVVLIDDAQWATDALVFVTWLQQHPDMAMRACFVLTVQEEALAERPETASLLTSLEKGGATRIRVGPLSERHQLDLLSQVLALDSTLRTVLVQRSGGNPMFAIHLLTDWVRRDILVRGAGGFTLAPGAEAALPADLASVWDARIDGFLAERAPSDVIALELAAILGQDVSTGEWHDACASDGITPDEGLIEALLDRKLVLSLPTGWSFVHGMLRECLLRRAPPDRAEAHHMAAAGAINPESLGSGERIARHLLHAGQVTRALPFALDALRGLRERGENDRWQAFFSVLEAATERLAPQPPEVRFRVLLMRLDQRIASSIGGDDIDAVLDEADAIVDHDPRLMLLSLRVRAAVSQGRGHLDAAEAIHDKMRRTLETVEPPWGFSVGSFDRGYAMVMHRMGRLEEARTWLISATKRAEAAGDDIVLAQTLLNRGSVEISAANFDDAEWYLRKALAEYEQLGSRIGLAMVLNSLGEVQRFRGNHESAIRLYVRSRDHYRKCATNRWCYPQINMAQSMITSGRVRAAVPLLLEIAARTRSGATYSPRFLFNAQLVLLECYARARAWSRFDQARQEIIDLRRTYQSIGHDYARAAQRAGEYAAEAGKATRALWSLGMAHEQWVALGRDEDAQRVLSQIEALTC
jgi:eukaryotic-like serine/threonine-protein kinase